MNTSQRPPTAHHPCRQSGSQQPGKRQGEHSTAVARRALLATARNGACCAAPVRSRRCGAWYAQCCNMIVIHTRHYTQKAGRCPPHLRLRVCIRPAFSADAHSAARSGGAEGRLLPPQRSFKSFSPRSIDGKLGSWVPRHHLHKPSIRALRHRSAHSAFLQSSHWQGAVRFAFQRHHSAQTHPLEAIYMD